jgi:hypothetical protein
VTKRLDAIIDSMDSMGRLVFCDDLFKCLTHIQRRRILVELLTESKMNISEDAILMQHSHLPKLEEYGFIDWDRDTNVVTKGPQYKQIRPQVEMLDNHKDKLPKDWV